MSRIDQPEISERSSVARRTSLILSLLAVAGFFAILMLAAAVQGTPVFRPVGEAEPSPTQTPLPDPQPSTSGLPDFEPPEETVIPAILTAIFVVVVGGVILLVVFLGIRLLVRTLLNLWRDRRLRRRTGIEVAAGIAAVHPVPSDSPDAVEIRRGIAQALVAIDRDAAPTDAIVAAWAGLEESAADAGMVRADSETAAEFTVRILARRSSTAAEVSALLRLYEDVRFGGLVATEQDRATAARYLRAIEEGWR